MVDHTEQRQGLGRGGKEMESTRLTKSLAQASLSFLCAREIGIIDEV